MKPAYLFPAALLCVPLLLASCAQGVSPGATGKSAGSISCDGFIKKESVLASEIGAFTEKPACERKYHPGGQGYVEIYRLGAFHRGQDATKQLWSVIMRAYGPLDGAPVSFNEDTLEQDRNFRKLSAVTPEKLAGNSGPAQVSTFDIGSVGHVCVDAFTKNADGSHTVVDLCRSVDINATDAERLALAQSIASVDMPDITP